MERVEALKHLLESAKYDSASIIQQSICYDKKREWSVLVSWGFAIQIMRGIISPRELESPTRTFINWYKVLDFTAYAFNTRPVAGHPCQQPFVFYINSTQYDKARHQIIGIYTIAWKATVKRMKGEDRNPLMGWFEMSKMAKPDSGMSDSILKGVDIKFHANQKPGFSYGDLKYVKGEGTVLTAGDGTLAGEGDQDEVFAGEDGWKKITVLAPEDQKKMTFWPLVF
ncbi:Protein of unknown function DUF604 [Cynara cardunculus var. scolymus]|uniref:Uncharacterized protein n=1 Tax=Cynara cardunculus var. scolymus TaxID=59895 RepID=A0A103XPK7_CYNCS|nr:Protein of unknown function DUF604 [Cynara cardunculus var. scolymus]